MESDQLLMESYRLFMESDILCMESNRLCFLIASSNGKTFNSKIYFFTHNIYTNMYVYIYTLVLLCTILTCKSRGFMNFCFVIYCLGDYCVFNGNVLTKPMIK